MANANGSASPGLYEAVAGEPKSLISNCFDADAMANHNQLLGFAGFHLELALQASNAIGALVDLVRANNTEDHPSKDTTGDYHEDKLLLAANLLAANLSSMLRRAASHFRNILKSTKSMEICANDNQCGIRAKKLALHLVVGGAA
jgi:hypothetical protein